MSFADQQIVKLFSPLRAKMDIPLLETHPPHIHRWYVSLRAPPSSMSFF